MNKKGFTLLELIITIAIMLTITVTAIISFTKISDKKKEEAYEEVKKQIVQSAEDYFGTNSYSLENIKEGSGNYAMISVGTLVSQGYLNKTTNPITSEAIFNCDYVKVTKENGEYKYSYVEETDITKTQCDKLDNYVVFKENGSPKIQLNISGNKYDKWYKDSATAIATVTTAGNGNITSVKYCNASGITCETNKLQTLNFDNIYSNSDSTEGNKVVCYKATNSSNKSTSVCTTYDLDTNNPVCVSNNGSTSWTNQSRTVTQYCSDNLSGCMQQSYSKNYTVDKKSDSITISDKVGHTKNCSVNVYVDKTKPTCDGRGGSTTWTNQSRIITQYCSDDLSGCMQQSYSKNYTKDKKTDSIIISDNAGNSESCLVDIYVDKTKPTCNLKLSGTKGNDNWYRSNVKIEFDDKSDNGGSGLKDYGISTSSNESYNKKTSGTQSKETLSTTWYGYVRDNAGNTNNCTKNVKVDKKAPIINYTNTPYPNSCAGHDGIAVEYQISDETSGVYEAYHYLGYSKTPQTYDYISSFKIKTVSDGKYKNKKVGKGPVTINRTWAITNPKGCGSPNGDGPGTGCYYNNTAVKDYAGNTATGKSSSCDYVGK